MPPLVYFDANIFKFAATKLPRLFPKEQVLTWGSKTSIHRYYEPGFLNLNERIRDPELKKEADLLEKIASLASAGRLKPITHHESDLETWGLPNMDNYSGRFYGVEISRCPSPVTYERVIFGGSRTAEEWQLSFLAGINDTRFHEIQKAVGAYQGPRRHNLNQLIDAFALWCAEFANCDSFLTLDFKLARMVSSDPKRRVKIPVFRPSDLLSYVEDIV